MIDVLGIDVGGTTTRVALFRLADGRPLEIDRWDGPTDRRDASATIGVGVADLRARHDLDAVRACGIGVPEYVREGQVRSALVIELGAVEPGSIGLPGETIVRVDSDVRCGAVAEWDELRDPAAGLLYVSLGTGLSSAFVLPGGVAWVGATGAAISLGEWPSPMAGVTLEGFASGAGIFSRHLAETGEARSAVELAAGAEAGDPRAHRLLAEAGTAVGSAIRQDHALLDPDRIVVGGGLGTAHGALWSALERAAAVPIPGRSGPVLRQAALGDRSGTLGAALLAAREVAA
jgi:glucokinase